MKSYGVVWMKAWLTKWYFKTRWHKSRRLITEDGNIFIDGIVRCWEGKFMGLGPGGFDIKQGPGGFDIKQTEALRVR